MTQYLYHAEELRDGIEPLDFMAAQRIELSAAAPCFETAGAEDEQVFVCIAGEADFVCGLDSGHARFMDMLYVPWRSSIKLEAAPGAVFMRISSPSDRDTQFAHIAFSDVAKDPQRHKVFGSTETASLRDVYMCIDDRFSAARLLMGICEGRPGGWTSWPPHEHAADREELYVYFNMGRSFAAQFVYEDPDEPLFCGFVRDGDLVAIGKGYHPNVSCPAGRIIYFYAMAARTAGRREFMTLKVQDGFGQFK